MKKVILAALFAVVAVLPAAASWHGKLDLNASAQPMILREAHDGQWLAGIAHPDLWSLYHGENKILHFGIFQAWNAEHGNASFGPLLGTDLMGLSAECGWDIPASLASVGEWAGIPGIFKPAVYLTKMLSIDAFGGYRRQYTPDVKGNWVYGGGATLGIPFGVQELQAGL